MLRELENLLDELVVDSDANAQKLAEHVKKINALRANNEIDDADHKELLEDAVQLIEVEKEASSLEAKVKLQQAVKMMILLSKAL